LAEDYPYTAALGSLGPGEADDWPDEELHDVQPLGFGQRLTRETYVRDQQRITLAEAVYKSSLMPAERLRERVPAMAGKGRLQEGADADIVVFDAGRFTERATFDSLAPSEGMRFVIVGGHLVVDEGELLGVTPGRPVRSAREP
jgi:N-acyl-D-aspartate/D-glutamate deacylase